MTKEEAIARIRKHKIIHKMDEPRAIYISEALDMAIKALEQQPCDDCISRQKVLEQTYLWSKDEFLRVTNPFDYLRKRIKSLPSVTPQPKTGHWIKQHIGQITIYKCSECGRIVKDDTEYDVTKDYPYCNCGAKMESESDKTEKLCRNCIHNKESESTIENCATCYEQSNFTPKPKGE